MIPNNTMTSLDWRAVKTPVTRVGRGDTIVLDGQHQRVISRSLIDTGGIEFLLNTDGRIRPVWFPAMAQVQVIRAEA